jgi:glycolate oxidase FAD binding subunit
MELIEELARACPGASPRPGEAPDAIDGVMPETVVFPRTNEEVAAVLRLAARWERTVVARGAGTKLDWGNPPRSAQVLVDLSRMGTVLEHARGDLVVRVEAGARLAEVNGQLAGAQQWLPVDEVVPGSTIGGVVGTGICGPSRYSQGPVRDLVIGVTVVRADGVIARAGSKVVKNVAGYDLAKLFTGSYGTLGIITEAIFRLRPAPPERRYVTASYPDEAALQPALAGVLRGQMAPAAIEVQRTEADGGISLSVLVEGRAGPVDRRAGALAEMLSGGDVSEHPPGAWGSLPGPVTLKMTTELRSVTALLALVRRLAAAHEVVPVVRGSAGTGVLFIGLASDCPASVLAALLGDLREGCARLGGHVTVVRAPTTVKPALDVWGPVPGLELMRRVKAEFDPDHRLAPGRFVGGI